MAPVLILILLELICNAGFFSYELFYCWSRTPYSMGTTVISEAGSPRLLLHGLQNVGQEKKKIRVWLDDAGARFLALIGAKRSGCSTLYNT